MHLFDLWRVGRQGGRQSRGQAGGPGLPEGPQSQPCLGSLALPEQSVERGVHCEQTELQACLGGPEHTVAQTLPPNGDAGTGAEGAVGRLVQEVSGGTCRKPSPLLPSPSFRASGSVTQNGKWTETP